MQERILPTDVYGNASHEQMRAGTHHTNEQMCAGMHIANICVLERISP
jgi:hypothetical protein